MSIVASLILMLAPLLEEADDLLALSAPSDAVARQIQNTGAIINISRINQQDCTPNGQPLDGPAPTCNVEDRIYDPFDGDERVAAMCSGHFVTNELFLTSAHCLEYALDPAIFPYIRIARGYFSPQSKLDLFALGRVVYSSKLGFGGKKEDWVLIETCGDPDACMVDEVPCVRDKPGMKDLVDTWRDTWTSSGTPSRGELRNGYLISSPLGFHLHVSHGSYTTTTGPALGSHELPSWPNSSGGAIFDTADGSLVGILEGINHSGRPYCTETQGKCTLHFPMQSSSYKMSGHYVPIHVVKGAITEDSIIHLDPRVGVQAAAFKRRSMRTRSGSKRKMRRQMRTARHVFGTNSSADGISDCVGCRECRGVEC